MAACHKAPPGWSVPGRMRFQYDPPAPFLLIAAHGVLTFNDSALQQTSNIPLSRTPLGILLADTWICPAR